MMTQLSVKPGIKKFGQKRKDVVMKLLQLHDRKAMMPKMKEDLTQEDRQKTLRYLMFIKEKRYGTVKARWCADGRPQ